MKYFKSPSFLVFNEKFNKIIHSKMKLFFSPKDTGPTSYVQVNGYRIELAKKFSQNGEYQNNLYMENKNKNYCPSDFGEYERILYSNILYENGTSFIISGAMGSGKSTTLNYIFNTIKNDDKCPELLLINFNFNKGYKKKNDPDLVENKFLLDLYEKLKAQIVTYISKYSIADIFANIITEYINDFASFFDLSMNAIHNDEWKNLDEKQKVYKIFKYIEKKSNDLELRVEMATKFLFFANIQLVKKGVIVIVFFDNLDRLPPISQENIIDAILNFNETANVRVVMTVRRSTKIKIDQQLKDNFELRDESPLLKVNRGEYIYHHIYHHGPSPRKLLISRLEYLEKHIYDISIFNSLEEEIINAVKLRTSELLNYLKDKNSSLSQAIYCVGGESNRLTLTIAPRFYCSAIIPFNELAENKQSLVRTLYSSNFTNPLMHRKDKYVVNLLSNQNYSFSLCNYFLLDFLHQSRETSVRKDNTIKEIFKVLKNYLGYSNKEILATFNYLMTDRRALIGSSYKPGFNSIDELNRIKKDTLRLTELGYRYLNGLFQNAEIYLQQCILSLKWDYFVIRDGEDTIMSRFILLRKALSYMKDFENKRVVNYNSRTSKRNNYFEFTISSPVTHIAQLIITKFLPIIKRNKYASGYEELQKWKDMIIFWQYNDNKFRYGNDLLNCKLVNDLQTNLIEQIETIRPLTSSKTS